MKFTKIGSKLDVPTSERDTHYGYIRLQILGIKVAQS